MNKNKFEPSEIRSRILKGLDRTIEKLIRKKQLENGELVFSKNGQVVHIKAKDIAGF